MEGQRMITAWTWDRVLENLDARVHMPKTAPTIDKTREALARFPLKYPENLQRVIMVAGTNGKGTTSKTLESLLRSAGQKTALYTSPHMIELTERIAFNGENISDDLFVETFGIVESACHDLTLSHFEVLTVMAAWLCFSPDSPIPPLDYFIFEIGMGGTWDATNAIPHQTNVITRLGLDHTSVLGNTLAEVAANKFGIVKKDSLVISLPLDISLAALREEVIDDTDCEWFTSPAFEYEVRMPSQTHLAGQTSDGVSRTARAFPEFVLFSKWGSASLSLPGARAAENMNLALTVFNELGFQPSLHLSALADVYWPGRMERLPKFEITCPVFFSGDHNEQGIASLLDLLRFYQYENLHLVIAIGVAKDLDAMLAPLLKLEKTQICFTTASFMGRTQTEYGAYVSSSRPYFSNPRTALQSVGQQAAPNDLIIVTGSLYTYVDLMKSRSPRT